MALTVTDAAYTLSIMAGKDQYKNYTQDQLFDMLPGYTKAPNFCSLGGAQIGIPRNEIIPNNTIKPILDALEPAI
jgi:amidase